MIAEFKDLFETCVHIYKAVLVQNCKEPDRMPAIKDFTKATDRTFLPFSVHGIFVAEIKKSTGPNFYQKNMTKVMDSDEADIAKEIGHQEKNFTSALSDHEADMANEIGCEDEIAAEAGSGEDSPSMTQTSLNFVRR